MPGGDPREPRACHTGEALVVMGLSRAELQELLEARPGPTLIIRLLKALRLIEPELATAYARAFEVVI